MTKNFLELKRGYYSRKHKLFTYSKNLIKVNDGLQDNNCENKMCNLDLSSAHVHKGLVVTSQIIFEVTEKCNLSCKYCGLGENYTYTKRVRNRDLDWNTAKVLCDYYIDIWKNKRPRYLKELMSIGFYGGEALINISLIKLIIDYLEKNSPDHIKFFYSMTTNGVFLLNNIDYLIKKDFHITVSLDGDKKGNKYRVDKNNQPVFNIIYKNLKKIQEKYEDYFINNIDVISVLNNCNSRESIKKFIDLEFGKIPEIKPISLSNVLNMDTIESMRNKKDSTRNVMDQNKNQVSLDLLIKCFSSNYYSEYRSLMEDETDTGLYIPTATCLPFYDRIFLTCRGHILPCEKVGDVPRLGIVENEQIKLNFKEVANFYNVLFRKFKEQCNICNKKRNCGICVFSDSIYVDNENVQCNEFISDKEMLDYLNISFGVLRDNVKLLEEVIKE